MSAANVCPTGSASVPGCTLRSLGRHATEWRVRKGYSTDPAWVGLKLVEEIGETVRALIAEHEGRPGRGDVVQEAAQSVIVLASLVHIVHPEASLFDVVDAEMRANACGRQSPPRCPQ